MRRLLFRRRLHWALRTYITVRLLWDLPRRQIEFEKQTVDAVQRALEAHVRGLRQFVGDS